MNNRKAFTLIEMLVVIGVILVLIVILVPVIAHTRTQADITAQKADFQAITAALEAYRQDFGDYPKNIRLQTWNYDQGTGSAPQPLEAPACFSLASALIGPGDAIPKTVGGTTEGGDGADGLGFRAQSQIEVTQFVGIPNPTHVSLSSLASWANNSPTKAQATQMLSRTLLVLSPGTAQEETVAIDPAIIAASSATHPPWITNTTALPITTSLVFPLDHSTTDPAPQFRLASGKIWPNYLPADHFKVAFINIPLTSGSSVPNTTTTYNYNVVGQPVLLDRWGQVIQYFPRYGPNNNRVNGTDSTFNPLGVTPPYVGPLYGYSSPKSIYPASLTTNSLYVWGNYGMHSIWDQRDGGVRFTTGPDGQTNTVPWHPLPNQEPGYNPGIALQWMLGDDNGDNLIDNGESLRYDGAFVLISAGPNKLDSIHGGFCNMLTPVPGSSPVTYQSISTDQKPQVFQNSGNIYNFDR